MGSQRAGAASSVCSRQKEAVRLGVAQSTAGLGECKGQQGRADPAGACRIRRGGGREWIPGGPRQVGDGNSGAPGQRRPLVIADRGVFEVETMQRSQGSERSRGSGGDGRRRRGRGEGLRLRSSRRWRCKIRDASIHGVGFLLEKGEAREIREVERERSRA